MNVQAKLPAIAEAYPFPANAFLVQKLTADLFSANHRAYCINDLGTGKTRAALFAFDWLKSLGAVHKMLVISPLSGVKRTWAREIIRELPWLKFVILHGTKKKRLELLEKDVDVYIINHDGVKVLKDELAKRLDINVVCVDELAVYRNGRSELNKSLREYVKHKKFVWGMTGSPMPRAVTDVWGQCACLTPWTIPKYFTVFRDQLQIKWDQYTWKNKPGAEERAVACMQPSVRYSIDEVVELPPRVFNYYECDLSLQQMVVYEAMKKKAIALIGQNKIDALNAGAVFSKLLQISLGYVYTRTGKVVTLDNTPRLQLILDLIDGSPHKVILFAPFTSALKGLSEMLTGNSVEHAIVYGDVTLKTRDTIFGEFQDTPRYKVLLAHPKCMAHSLTLTAATTTVWAGPTTSLEIFEQANGRTFRAGQTQKTLVAMIGGTKAEQRVYKILGANEEVQNKCLTLLKELTTGEA